MEATDLGTVYFFSTHQIASLNPVILALTALGGLKVLAPMAVCLIGVLAWLRGWRTAGLYAVAVIVTALLCLGTKYAVGRERPAVRDRIVAPPASPSFPSGHAANSLVIYGLFALLASRNLKSSAAQWTICTLLLFLLPLLIGFSRIYLTVHFLTDVLCCWLLGLGIILVAYGLDRGEPGG